MRLAVPVVAALGLLLTEGPMTVDHIHWLGHATFRIEDGERQIYIDPFQLQRATPKADVILITHAHFDHDSPADLSKIEQPGTVFVAPPDVTGKLAGKKATAVKPGDSVSLGPITVEAVPAYNIGKAFHAKESGWVGFVITLSSGQRIYHAGDTDAIPEMDAVKADVALLPCGGTYTMSAAEVAAAANRFKPAILIPMHWGDIVGSKADAEAVQKAFAGKTVIKPVER